MVIRHGEIDLDLQARLETGAGDGLLERVAVTLGSTLDLREVLRRLAEMVQEVTSAQRCSIVLLEGNRLRPAVALGTHPDDDLWGAFRSMDPIDLSAEHWELLRAGQALAFEDARQTTVIPRQWIERFRLRAIVVVPLLAHDEPIGVMAVDWPEVRHVAEAELAMLEAIGTYAALAVRNARLHEEVATKSSTLERLVEVASALNSSSSLSQVLELICASFQQLLGTTHCSVNLTDTLDPLRLHTLASAGEPWFERGAGGAAAVIPEELGALDEAWGSRSGPLVYPSIEAAGDGVRAPVSVRSAALFPLFGSEGLIGLVITGFPARGGPGEPQVEAGQTLAELAATAISRADLHEHLRRRLRQLELLSRLSEVVSGETSIEEVLGEMAGSLAADLGMHLDAMLVADDDVRAAIGGAAPGTSEAETIASWRAALEAEAGPLRLRSTGEAVLVPVVHHHRVLGALRVQVGAPLGLTDEEFLLAIGGGCAEIVYRALVGRTLAESQRRVAVVAERERIARDLHDSAGQVVTSMGMKLAGYLDDAPDERWRHRLTTLLRQAQQADRELREAISSLLFLEVQREGLVRSLRELASRFGATTGIDVGVVMDGSPAALLPEHDDALFRVAHEALSNVERHAEASTATVTLVYDVDETLLRVDDDGVGMPDGEHPSGDPLRFGLRGIERRLRELGGSLTLRRLAPHGTRVEARLPAELGGVEVAPAEH